MRQKAAIYLYRALLREARQQFNRFGSGAISLRAPLNSAPGTWNSNATAGLQYQVETLDTLVPGLAVLPQEHQLPLTLQGLKQLVRDNFRAQAVEAATHQHQHQQQQPGGASTEQQLQPYDQGFAALRALPEQAYLEACSSSCVTDGVLIEATSCFNPRADPYAGLPTGSSSSRDEWFSYRIRVSNSRRHCIKVLGRGWVISSALGELQGYVQLSADNAIVGQQPVIPPGGCFEYYSCASLKASSEPGSMKGHLLVSLLGPAGPADAAPDAAAAAAAEDLRDRAAEEQQQQQLEASSSSSSSRRDAAAAGREVELERVAMPVREFKLQSPATAAAAVQAGRARAAAGTAQGSQEEEQQAAAAETLAGIEHCSSKSSSSREECSGSDDSSSSDDEGSRR